MINNSTGESLQVDYHLSFLIKYSILVTMSSFSMGKIYKGYQMGILNTIEDQLSTFFHWNSYKFIFITISSALLCIGASFGALISGKLINYFGRRKGILFTNTLMLVFICLSIIPYEFSFLVFRFCIGICIGICSTVPPIFINEISPREIKCMLGVLIQLMIASGILFAFIAGGISNYCLSGYWSWAFPLIFPCLVIIIQSYYLLEKFNYDTPKWLLFNERQTDIERIMRKIYKPWAWQSRISEIEDEKTSIKSIKEALPCLITRSLPRPMTLAYILCIFQQLAGINLPIFYSKAILSKYDEFSSISTILTTIIGLFNVLFIIPCFYLIKSVSRRFLLLQGFIGLFFCYSALVAVCYVDQSFYPNWIKFSLIILSVGFFETSLGTIVWIYITELISFDWIGSAISVQWVCAAGISGVYPLIFKYGALYDYQIIYICFAFSCAVGFGLIYFFTIDIKGVDIDELAIQFNNRRNTEDHALS